MRAWPRCRRSPPCVQLVVRDPPNVCCPRRSCPVSAWPPQPFTSAENALQNINDVSEGIVSSDLKAFLEASLPQGAAASHKPGKAPKLYLGVLEPKIGTAVQEALGVPCNSNDTIAEIVRGCRLHFAHFVEQLAG
jgi:nucleolar protein 56